MKKDITQRDEGNLYAVQELLEDLADLKRGQWTLTAHTANSLVNGPYKQMLKTVNKVIHNLSYGGYEF